MANRGFACLPQTQNAAIWGVGGGVMRAAAEV